MEVSKVKYDTLAAPMSLEFRQLNPGMEETLSRFFQAFKGSKGSDYFTPHPLTADEAKRLCFYTGQDLYYLAVDGDLAIGYGLLRGWDEGYEIPSLGIAIHPDFQGLGFGKSLMYFLHSAAKRKGASKIRLRVCKDNETARSLYESLGFKFTPDEGTLLLGLRDL